MRKIWKDISIALACLFLMFALCSVGFLYKVEWKLTELGTFQNEETGYSVLFQEKGCPFLFGPSEVRISLIDDRGKTVDSFTSLIYNDGSNLHKSNARVEWYGNRVRVTLSGDEQPNEVHELEYEEDKLKLH